MSNKWNWYGNGYVHHIHRNDPVPPYSGGVVKRKSPEWLVRTAQRYGPKAFTSAGIKRALQRLHVLRKSLIKNPLLWSFTLEEINEAIDKLAIAKIDELVHEMLR